MHRSARGRRCNSFGLLSMCWMNGSSMWRGRGSKGGANWSATLMTVCHETHRRKEVRNCVRDGGRSSGAGRQGQASNHRKLRRSKAGVVSVAEKAGLDPVRYGSERRARANR